MEIKKPEPEADEPRVKPPALKFDIDTLRLTKHLSRALFSGVCAAEGWGVGKQVGEAEFDAAVRRFTGAPTDGGRGRRKCSGT